MKSVLRQGVLWVFALWTVFPIYWLLNTSLKMPLDVTARPPTFIFAPTFANYTAMLHDPAIIGFFVTTLIVAVGTTIFTVLLSTPAAYVLARFRFRGNTDIGFWILSSRFTPPVAMLIPFFVMFEMTGLLNTYAGLIIAHVAINLSMGVWLMRSFFMGLPKELEEAASLDGASPLKTFLSVILPISRTGIAAIAILTFLFTWNEFLFSLVLGGSLPTVAVGLYKFIGYEQIEWGHLSAAAIIMLLPVLAILLLFQKHLVQGLTMGAVK
ncbi:carbohydrate ABC transporter permease [Acidisoma cellulosilytica]|uniref:Carbohydrate ABC transporter permease n=1 Tax=Acidisoma cellulosilyticum TaxID=2802395 RepID=A0A963Z016_9PROT|nr:carbohydrate ABC transporter permease [Acidisoma cellulosilyticum]MCB8880210.1 carbohydrate ABC transporter permease [Acidisoma cellulosilyticum]